MGVTEEVTAFKHPIHRFWLALILHCMPTRHVECKANDQLFFQVYIISDTPMAECVRAHTRVQH